MFSSLKFGPDQLEEVVRYDTKIIKGVERQIPKPPVIDKKQALQEQLAQENQGGLFEIGHSEAVSKTFIPHFLDDPDHQFMYGDIAGLLDANGEFMDFINCFMNKRIFNIAKKIKFIVPFTQNQLEVARGHEVIKQIEVILNICQDNIADLIESIQPVLTKCEITDDDDAIDLDVVHDNLVKMFR